MSPGGGLLAIVTGCLLVATLPATRIGPLAGALALALICAALLRPPPKLLWRRGRIAGLALLGVLLPLVPRLGWDGSALIALRAGSVVLLALSLSARIDVSRVGPALRGLGVPSGFSAAVHGVLAQVGTLEREARSLKLAGELRGARGIRHGPQLLARLFQRSVRTARRQELAARLRGYDPNRLPAERPVWRDLPPLVALSASLIGLHLWAAI